MFTPNRLKLRRYHALNYSAVGILSIKLIENLTTVFGKLFIVAVASSGI